MPMGVNLTAGKVQANTLHQSSQERADSYVANLNKSISSLNDSHGNGLSGHSSPHKNQMHLLAQQLSSQQNQYLNSPHR